MFDLGRAQVDYTFLFDGMPVGPRQENKLKARPRDSIAVTCEPLVPPCSHHTATIQPPCSLLKMGHPLEFAWDLMEVTYSWPP